MTREEKEFISMSEYRRLRVVNRGDDWWVDHEAPPNGIGPICMFCGHLVDWPPTDHKVSCPVRKYYGWDDDES